MVILKILAVIGFILIAYKIINDLYKYYKKGNASYNFYNFSLDIGFMFLFAGGGAYLLTSNKYIWESLLIIGVIFGVLFGFFFGITLNLFSDLINYNKKKMGIVLSIFLLLFGLTFIILWGFLDSVSDPFYPSSFSLAGVFGLIYFVFFCKEEKE